MKKLMKWGCGGVAVFVVLVLLMGVMLPAMLYRAQNAIVISDPIRPNLVLTKNAEDRKVTDAPVPVATAQPAVPTNTPQVEIAQPAAPTSIPIVTTAQPAGVPAEAQTAQLVDVVDGDTIRVLLDGREEPVRYVGIDTPERGQPGYQAATEANRLLLGSGLLYLVRDRTDRDRYDRLLRYVYNGDGLFVDAEMVRQGWAQPVEYDPDTLHAAEFRQLALEAAQNGAGFWAGTSAYDGAMSYGLTTGDINVRSGPGIDFEVSGSAVAGTPVTIFGRNEAGDWVQVRTPERLGGWMYAPLLAMNVPVAGVVVASDIPVVVQSTAAAPVAPVPAVIPTPTAPPPVAAPAQPAARPGNCDPSYPTVCIPSPPPDLDCGEISFRRFTVIGADPHRFDGDHDGIGCES